MNPTDPELEALRRKIDNIEADLLSAKNRLARLESAQSRVASESPRDELIAPELSTEAEPHIAPPPLLVEPPVLDKKPPESKSRPLRDWLASCHLLPPGDEGDTEVRLAAWWATRLGALLAVIGVVFFAVYVSRNTSPLVKLIELIAVSMGIGGIGLWLERSVPKFARLLVGAGLALLYFSSVAAYAIPATRVIDEVSAAITTQLLVVLAIVLFALWRRSESTVTMAVLLGYASALAGCYAELDSFVIWSALSLGLIAVLVKLKRGWRSPSVVAVPLMYGTYAAFYFWRAPDVLPPMGVALWFPLIAALGLFVCRDGLQAWRFGTTLTREDRILQNLNTSAALTAGWSVTWHLQPASLELFYFGAAAILLLIACGWHAAKQRGSLVVVTATQASAMVALGLATHFQGHLTSLVLLAQVAGMLVASRLPGMRGLRVMLYLVWGYSLFLFMDAVGQSDSVSKILVLFYLGLSAAMLGFDQRWHEARADLNRFAGVLLGIAALSTTSLMDGTPWKTLWLGGVALVLCAGGWPARAWRGAAVAAGFAVFGMFMVVRYPARSHEPWEHWMNGLGMVIVVVLNRSPGHAMVAWGAGDSRKPGSGTRFFEGAAAWSGCGLCGGDGGDSSRDQSMGETLAVGDRGPDRPGLRSLFTWPV